MRKKQKILAASTAILALAIYGCTGDTDGGSGADSARNSDPYVSDGSAGGTLSIELRDSDRTIGVGDTVGFFVRATAPDGSPQRGIRIFCDSERGVAILEPADNGASVESTDDNGEMSGQIGGLTPGSYILECRGQQGFNLVGRITVFVTGDVPNGFQGFPGAAGGNIGGGRIVDVTPDVDDGVGLRVTQVRVQDAGGASAQGPLDVSRGGCVTGDFTDPCAECSLEPFKFATYSLSLKNDTNENVFISTVEVAVGSRTVVAGQGQAVEVSKGGGVGSITGNLTTVVNCPSGTSFSACYNGGTLGNTALIEGTRNYRFTITGVTEAGNSFEISKDVAIQFDSVNNCSSGTAVGACSAKPATCT